MEITCREIDDELMEQYALSRVREPNASVAAHILRCENCLERMVKASIQAAIIRQSISEQLV